MQGRVSGNRGHGGNRECWRVMVGSDGGYSGDGGNMVGNGEHGRS